MPPTAHPQIAIRVFVQESTSLPFREVSKSFNELERLINKTHREVIPLGEGTVEWAGERRNNGTFIEGTEIIYNSNAIPANILAGHVAIIDDLISENESFNADDFKFEFESEDTTFEEAKEKAEQKELEIDVIDTDTDVIYSCSAAGDLFNVNRPLFNSFIGVGAVTSDLKEKLNNRVTKARELTGMDLFVDTVEAEEFSKVLAYYNSGEESLSGEVINEQLDAIDNDATALIVGEISRLE